MWRQAQHQDQKRRNKQSSHKTIKHFFIHIQQYIAFITSLFIYKILKKKRNIAINFFCLQENNCQNVMVILRSVICILVNKIFAFICFFRYKFIIDKKKYIDFYICTDNFSEYMHMFVTLYICTMYIVHMFIVVLNVRILKFWSWLYLLNHHYFVFIYVYFGNVCDNDVNTFNN